MCVTLITTTSEAHLRKIKGNFELDVFWTTKITNEELYQKLYSPKDQDNAASIKSGVGKLTISFPQKFFNSELKMYAVVEAYAHVHLTSLQGANVFNLGYESAPIYVVDGELHNSITHQYSNHFICDAFNHINNVKQLPSSELINIAKSLESIAAYQYLAKAEYHEKDGDWALPENGKFDFYGKTSLGLMRNITSFDVKNKRTLISLIAMEEYFAIPHIKEKLQIQPDAMIIRFAYGNIATMIQASKSDILEKTNLHAKRLSERFGATSFTVTTGTGISIDIVQVGVSKLYQVFGFRAYYNEKKKAHFKENGYDYF